MASENRGLLRLTIDGKTLEGCEVLDFCLEGSRDGQTWEHMTPWVALGDYQRVAVCFTMGGLRPPVGRLIPWARKELANLWRMLKR